MVVRIASSFFRKQYARCGQHGRVLVPATSSIMINSADLLVTPMEAEGDDELFRSLRGFLIFGRIIGLLPYKGVFTNSSSNLKFSWISFPSIFTYGLLSVITFNTFLEFLQSTSAPKRNAFQIAQSVRSTLYYFWGTFIFYNFILRSKQFLHIFHAWKSTSVYFSKPDLRLKRDVTLIVVVVLVSATLENATLYVDIGKNIVDAAQGELIAPSKTNVTSVLKSYYYNWHRSWAAHFKYHPSILAIVFIQHKWILFSWNCMDIWITVLGRALYFRFKALCEVAEEKLVQPLKDKQRFMDNPETFILRDEQDWKQMERDHRALNELLQVFERFLSPLIFMSYSVNIYYISMQLLDGLTLEIQKNTIFVAINRPWSFAHLVLRVWLLSVCWARVNTYAHRISLVINECPAQCYSSDISRLDKRVNGGRDIGLTGLGCFTVTKPFILTMIGVIFTVELVLLQVIPDDDNNAGQGKNCCCST